MILCVPFCQVKKREQKIVGRFKKHAERTAQAFEDERATRRSKFMLIGEEVSKGWKARALYITARALLCWLECAGSALGCSTRGLGGQRSSFAWCGAVHPPLFTLLLPFDSQVADTERSYDRAEEKAVRLVVREILAIRRLLQQEKDLRETEDNTLLDAMLYSQQRLQGAILASFGAESLEDVE